MIYSNIILIHIPKFRFQVDLLHKHFCFCFWSLIGNLQQYDRSKSSTYKVDGTEWKIRYANTEGPQLAGVLCEDTICVSLKRKGPRGLDRNSFLQNNVKISDFLTRILKLFLIRRSEFSSAIYRGHTVHFL